MPRARCLLPLLVCRSALVVLLLCDMACGADPGEDSTAAPAVQIASDAMQPRENQSGTSSCGNWADAAELVERIDQNQVQRTATTAAVFAAIGLGPILVLIASGFVRITIVLSLLRQALGTPGVPPNQVLTAVAFLLTLLVMTPVWNQVYDQAVVPLVSSQDPPDWPTAWKKASQPVHAFMSRQIQAAGNWEDIWLFLQYLPDQQQPATYEDVPMRAMLPAFVLSELKTAFLIGFQIFLPFLVIDLVVSATTMAMGMLMLPPQIVAIPLKLLLFVMVDGWHLVAQMLLASFLSAG